MQWELKGVRTTPIPQKPLRPRITLLLYNTPIVDIAAISAIGFHFNIYWKDNEVFTTSLYEINQIIAKREEVPVEETNKELVKRLLPNYLLNHRDAFSKAALNILPPHQTYNYKI